MDFSRKKKRRFRFGLILRLLLVLIVIAAGVAFWLTRVDPLPAQAFAGLSGEADRGERIFWATGCASCHAAEGATGNERLVLAGGRRFVSDFGTFVAPNVSSDPLHGIGAWPLEDVANAVMRGVSPGGTHYYPALPYTSYRGMEMQDMADLHAYLGTLPQSGRPNEPHELNPPYNIRRALGFWKLMFAREHEWAVEGELTLEERRGRYLSEVLGHCGECHTPRNGMGGLVTSRWFAGAPNPSGEGRIPNISPARLRWTEEDLVAFFRTGLTPEFDTVGGAMAEVIRDLEELPQEDLEAIAAYMQRVEPVQ